MSQSCPLCKYSPTHSFYQSPQRTYLRCPHCALIFVMQEDLLPPKEEKRRYDLHENNPYDPGYRNFLAQLFMPLTQRLEPPPLTGLDFGSGPGPALSVMLEEIGYNMTLYDPYYAPQTDVLGQTYDFVTCTETIEHFHSPQNEWGLLVCLVKPGGCLGIMTQLIDDLQSFPNLHYIKDETHVSFFSRRTFSFLAQRDGLTVEFIGDRVILFHKPETEKQDNLAQE